jgi:hypothetical protein
MQFACPYLNSLVEARHFATAVPNSGAYEIYDRPGRFLTLLVDIYSSQSAAPDALFFAARQLISGLGPGAQDYRVLYH